MSLVFLPYDAGGQMGKIWTQSIFRYHLAGIEEETVTDFEQERSGCEIGLDIGWQADLLAISDGPIHVTRAVDDRGRVFLADKVSSGKWRKREKGKGTVSHKLSIPVPPRGARSIALHGYFELEVPLNPVTLRVSLKERDLAAEAGGYRVTGSQAPKNAGHRVILSIRHDEGKLSTARVLKVLAWKISRDKWSVHFPYPLARADPIVDLKDGSVEVTVTLPKEKADAVDITLMEGMRRIRVPFDLDGIPLPRK